MKIHNVLIEGVANALTDVFIEGKKSDKVIEKLLKSNPKWGSRDRAFVAEQTYEVVRWWRKLQFLLHGKDIENKDFKTTKRQEFINLVGLNLRLQGADISHVEAFKAVKDMEISPNELANLPRKIKASIPDWLDELGCNELGEKRWEAEMEAANRSAKIALRLNTLKPFSEKTQQHLYSLGWFTSTTPLSKEALILEKRGNIFATEPFKQGFFEVQDVGSQLIAPFLQAEAGQRVIDACAGAGGKSLHLATLMQNKGRIISMDTEGWKLEELRRRARRNGVNIIETREITSTKIIKRLHDSADRLLLDVPCSGLGVLRRNPDAKWRLSPNFMSEIKNIQANILANYAKMLKKGGLMVYATCSIMPSENEQQVENFLANHKDFRLIAQKSVSPATTEGVTDGFFMALLAS
jgi:16S rRNA (cytosine967-C5)-methyltransferase